MVVGWIGLVGLEWMVPDCGFFPLGAEISAVSCNEDQIDLFIAGNDGLVYTAWWTAGFDWSGVDNNWEPIGGVFPVGAPVAALSRFRDQLNLFTIGNDGVVYTAWWTQGQDWSGRAGWGPIGDFFPTGV